MNQRILALAQLALLTAWILSSTASAQSHVNITLEGPWILYTEKNLANWPVLVALSPNGVVDENSSSGFHTLTVSAGDGFPVKQAHVYCLTFDGECGGQGGKSMNMDHNPRVVAPLPVTVPTKWDWSHKYSAGAIAFILPMPDSFSTDGGWYMRFAKTFDQAGKTYKYYKGIPQYALGVHLYYDSGPGGFTLQTCDPNVGSSIDLNACIDQPGTYLSNIGTLSISMKSHDDVDACDPHVRHAYPRMIGLLDAKNDDIAVIDVAKGSDKNNNNAPTWDQDNDSWRCLDHDEQKPKAMGSKQENGNAPAHSFAETAAWLNQLNPLLVFIDSQDKNPDFPAHPELLLAQIKRASDAMDVAYPRFSQTALLLTLLKQSKIQLDQMLSLKAKLAQQPAKADSAFATLDKLEAAVITEILTFGPAPTKSGADCKAPVMLVK